VSEPDNLSQKMGLILKNLKVTIVGLGLMGGSLAMALRPFIPHLTAVDPNQPSLDAALKAGIIDRGTADLTAGLSEADIIILATPVRTIIETLNQLPSLRPDGCLVLDLGSTKGQVCNTMNTLPAAFQTIGGHPMCGKESFGFQAAGADLYRKQNFVLCRTARTTAETEQTALAIVEAVGGRPLFLPPGLHDDLVSLTSHLPYLISSLLMRQAAETAEEHENLWQVSASGFKDTSRLSGSSPAVMGDILLTNRTAILAQLGRYRQAIDELITLLKMEDDTQLLAWLEKAQEEYQNYKTFRAENS
jgi:prephenate dehydrogenase